MAEVISSHNKTYLLVYHEIIFKVLSFHRLSAWVKHQIVDVNIQGVSYAKNSVEFPIPTELQWVQNPILPGGNFSQFFDKFLN